MQRLVASLPDSMAELCLIRLGFRALRVSALPYLYRLGKAIDRASADSRSEGSGLLHSERFAIAWNHVGVLQYWTSFEAMEAWSHRPPHSAWWKEAVDRGRTKGDFGIYHEAFVVPRESIESIYIDCGETIGLATFGKVGEPVGPATTSRGRLGRRSGH